jgi:hypothetical protein
MSTQRRDGRWAPTTEIGRRSLRLSQNQSWSIPKPEHSSRRDHQGAATLHECWTGLQHSGFAVGSRLAQDKDLANRSKQAKAVLVMRSFPAPNASDRMVCPASQLPAMAARNPLQQDTRNQQHVWSFCPGSPPLGRAAGSRPLRLIGYPPIPPAVFARLHPTLPDVLAASRSRTERYDGKGNLYFKHAA